MKHSKTSKSQRLKDPTHAWLLGLWNQWFALNKDRFHYPLVCKQAGGYNLVMGFQGLHPGLTFEISMNGAFNGIFFSWDSVENKGQWDCLHEADLLEYRTPDNQYYCGYCMEDMITYYPSREAQWEQHVFEQMLLWCNDNLHSGRIIVPLGSKSWDDETCGAQLDTPENAVRKGYYTNQSVWIPVVVGEVIG